LAASSSSTSSSTSSADTPKTNNEAAAAAQAQALLARSDLWQSRALAAKLEQQMTPLAVVTGAVPAWVRWLPRLAPFLWSLEARSKSMRAMAFGVSRGIVAMQEELHPTAVLRTEYEGLLQREDWDRAMRVDQRINDAVNKHATSQVAKNTLAKASSGGAELLREAMSAFADLSFLRSGSMEVIFKSETGFGSGVTAGFYNRIAAQLQTRGVALGLAPVGVAPPIDLVASSSSTTTTTSASENDDELARIAVTLFADHPLFSPAAQHANNNTSSPGTTNSNDQHALAKAVLATHTLVVSSGTAAMTSEGYAATAAAFDVVSNGNNGSSAAALVPLVSAPAWKANAGQFGLRCAGNEEDDDDKAGKVAGASTAVVDVTSTANALPPAIAEASTSENSAAALPAAEAPTEATAATTEDATRAEGAILSAPVDEPVAVAAGGKAGTSPAPSSTTGDHKGRGKEKDGMDGAELLFAPEFPLPTLLVPKPFSGSFSVVRGPSRRQSTTTTTTTRRVPRATLLYTQQQDVLRSVANKDAAGAGPRDNAAEKGKRKKRGGRGREEDNDNDDGGSNSGGGSSSGSSEGVEDEASGAALLLLRLPHASGGRTLDLWPAGVDPQERTSHAVKVTVLGARVVKKKKTNNTPTRLSSEEHSTVQTIEVEVDVEGALPQTWLPPPRNGDGGDGDSDDVSQDEGEDGEDGDGGDSDDGGGGVAMSSIEGAVVTPPLSSAGAPVVVGGVELSGACWNAPLWVPDATASAFVPSSSVSSSPRLSSSSLTGAMSPPQQRKNKGVSVEAAAALASSVHGTIAPRHGLFPAPLPPGADGGLVVRRFRFLGRLLGKALVDGHLVPLPLHPALFALLRGDPLDPSRYLVSPGSHMALGSKGSHVAQLFSLLPELDAIHALSSSDGGGGDDGGLAALLEKPQPFTNDLPLGEWLEYGDLPWADPITGAALPPPPSVVAPSSSSSSMSSELKSGGGGEGGGVWWEGSVTGLTLRPFLHALADLWLGRGVARQVAALRRGLGDLVGLDAGVLSFEPTELRNLLCGDSNRAVEWDDESLRKTLRPKGDFRRPKSSSSTAVPPSFGGGLGAPGGGGGEDTLDWLRLELVALGPRDRLRFLELTTGVRAPLAPGNLITVQRAGAGSSGGGVMGGSSSFGGSSAPGGGAAAAAIQLPYFHSCTNTLDLPLYSSQEALREGLRTAIANGFAGGFSEIARAT
jgi:hypothetical protein